MSRMPTEKSNGPGADDCSDPLFADYRALIIGIGKYNDSNVTPLPRPVRDVSELQTTLHKIGYSPERIRCLCDEKATFKEIRKHLLQMQAMKLRVPLLIVFWAGHGVANRFGESFVLPHDVENPFAVDDLIHLIRSANARHKAIFVDTCFSAPFSERVFMPAWHRLDLINTPPTLAFVGASTYLAIEQAGSGGILASCLKEALTDKRAFLCDEEGKVYLHGVMQYLQQQVRPRAGAAWREAGLWGDAPQEPYISFRPGEPVLVGRNVPIHVRHCVDRSKLPDSA